MILDDLRNIFVSARTDFRHKLWQLYIEQQETA